MGGQSGRIVFATAATLALLVTSVGEAGTAAPEGAGSVDTDAVGSNATCEGWTPEIPAPPFEEHAIVIRMDWKGSDKYSYGYYATTAEDPVNDPGTFVDSVGSFVAWGGGCTPEADRSGCRRLDPLILTEAGLDEVYMRDGTPIPHNTHATVPGNYTLAARPGGICLYEDDPGVISHYERLAQDRAAAPEAVELTATIEYYEKGAAKPYRTETRSSEVPLDVAWDDPEHIRTFGDPIVLPASGETSGPAVLPPLDPRIGLTEAGALPASSEDEELARDEEPTADDGTAEVDPASQPGQFLIEEDPGLILGQLWLLWVLSLERPQVSQETRDELGRLMALLALLTPDEPKDGSPTIDLEAPGETPVEPAESAIDALAEPADDTIVAPPAITGPDALTFVGEPPKLKPKQQKRMQDQARVWVQLPAKVKIDTGNSKKPKRMLKTKTWYQIKLDSEDTQVFYDEKGKLLGRNRRTDPIQVRVWVPKEDEP